MKQKLYPPLLILLITSLPTFAYAEKICEFNDPITGTTPGCRETGVGGGGPTIAYATYKDNQLLTYVTKTTESNGACRLSGSSTNYYASGDCHNYRIYSNTPATNVNLSGTVTYDRVPYNSGQTGLNYNGIIRAPVRGANVEITYGTSVLRVVTNTQGAYSATVPSGTSVRVRVLAQMTQNNTNISVRDNTDGNALYSVITSPTSYTATNNTLNIHIPSGYNAGTGSYTAARSAAPFAIFDSIYEAVSDIRTATSATIPTLNVYWSPNNNSATGSLAEGDITTSHYNTGSSAIYILGDEGIDTDEYDSSVVVHEFVHFMEHKFFRSDSLGGQHGLNERLDKRIAFSEALGNAMQGIILGVPRYSDTMGSGQQNGFHFSLTQDIARGWFNETATQEIIYQTFDNINDPFDTVSFTFAEIFNALSSTQFRSASALTSIYSYLEILRQRNPTMTSAINTLAQRYQVFGTGWFGDNETNNGGLATNLPVYRTLNVGGTTTVCSHNQNGIGNKLGNYGFVRLNLSTTGTRTITVTRVSGPTSTNPTIQIFRNGVQIGSAISNTVNRETLTQSLNGVQHIIVVSEQSNTSAGPGLEACFNVNVI